MERSAALAVRNASTHTRRFALRPVSSTPPEADPRVTGISSTLGASDTTAFGESPHRSDGCPLDDEPVGSRIGIGGSSGRDGFRGDLPLDRELEGPIVVDAFKLRDCHPMFALRLRVFIDWHTAAGHAVHVILPSDAITAQVLADLGTGSGVDPSVIALPAPSSRRLERVLPITSFHDHVAVEDIARQAVELLQRQTDPFGSWGEAMHMAISELCDNALQHGKNELGAYIVADRIMEPGREMRLAIADLGIGIPEHIRARHPEWHDDTGAITRALDRGVSGTDDPHRGNGFAEVFDAAMRTDLVRSSSAADMDIRAGKGRVGVKIFGGSEVAEPRSVERPRRGTWITYTVTTA